MKNCSRTSLLRKASYRPDDLFSAVVKSDSAVCRCESCGYDGLRDGDLDDELFDVHVGVLVENGQLRRRLYRYQKQRMGKEGIGTFLAGVGDSQNSGAAACYARLGITKS